MFKNQYFGLVKKISKRLRSQGLHWEDTKSFQNDFTGYATALNNCHRFYWRHPDPDRQWGHQRIAQYLDEEIDEVFVTAVSKSKAGFYFIKYAPHEFVINVHSKFAQIAAEYAKEHMGLTEIQDPFELLILGDMLEEQGNTECEAIRELVKSDRAINAINYRLKELNAIQR